METVSLIASVVSVILAGFAIWLSFEFFKMSSQEATKSTESSKRIEAAADRLEKLFEKLYTDTFQLLKETFVAMRQEVFLTDRKIPKGGKAAKREQSVVKSEESEAEATEQAVDDATAHEKKDKE